MSRQYIYKKIKIAVPHCPECGEQLAGNNSMASPYHCSCGVWLYDYLRKEFDIIPADKLTEEDKE